MRQSGPKKEKGGVGVWGLQTPKEKRAVGRPCGWRMGGLNPLMRSCATRRVFSNLPWGDAAHAVGLRERGNTLRERDNTLRGRGNALRERGNPQAPASPFSFCA